MIKILIHTYLIILLLLIIYYEHVQLNNILENNSGCFCIKINKRFCLGLLFPKILLLLILLFTMFTERSLKYFTNSIVVNTYMILTFIAYIILFIYYTVIASDIFNNNIGFCPCANTGLSSVIYYFSILGLIFILIMSLKTFKFFFVHNYR